MMSNDATASASAAAAGRVPSDMLSDVQLAQFERDGFLVLPEFFSSEAYLAHAKELVTTFNAKDHPLTKFSTGGDGGHDGSDHVGDRYFLESGDDVRYFLEEGAVDEDGKLNRDPSLAVNKVGHALHSRDATFSELSLTPRIQHLIRSLGVFSDPHVLQSMLICKQPSIGGAVPAHNDSTFLYTSPPSAVGLWFALEDCTANNGCLAFLPGSHRWPGGESAPPISKATTTDVKRPYEVSFVQRPDHHPPLGELRGVNQRFVRRVPGDTSKGTTFETIAKDEEAEWDDKKAVLVECKAGTLVLIHGSVLHKSSANLSPVSRYIYTFHVIEGDHGRAVYDEKNWLQVHKGGKGFTRLFQ